jgi:Ca2+/Na+ antiporter
MNTPTPIPVDQRLTDALRKIAYFEPDQRGGAGIGKYILTLFLGIMGGMVPNLMMREFKDDWVANNKRSLHLLLLMIIMTSTLGSDAFGTRIELMLLATVVLYVWFICLIKCRPKYTAGILGALALATLMGKYRQSILFTNPKLATTLASVELYVYAGTMLATLPCLYLSIPSGERSANGIVNYMFGDVFGKPSIQADTTTSFGNFFDHDE